MANVEGAKLKPIYDRLHAAPQYHPMEANTFADWSVEAGDVVTISRDGTNYTSPVHSSRLSWKKGAQIQLSSTGNEKRESVAKMSQRKYRGGSAGLRNSHYQHIYVDDVYKQMRSGLELTGSTAHLYVDNIYAQMQAGLALTSSTAHLYVDNMYAQMKSGLELTSSAAKLYVDNKYAQMQSGLELTSSTAHLYVDNMYAQMKSGLELTSSSAMLYVDNKYAQMQSGLELTSSTAHLYVDNMYAQMKSGLELTSSSAMLYVQNRTTKARILATINGEGKSEALIEADRVSVSGTTTLNDVMTITDQSLYITKNTRLSGTLTLASLQMRSGNDDNTITPAVFAKLIKSASVANNTLTLTSIDGTTTTFSKATSVSGNWSGDTLNITAGSGTTPVFTTKLSVEFWSQNVSNATLYYVSAAAADQGAQAPNPRSSKRIDMALDGNIVKLRSYNGSTPSYINGSPFYDISTDIANAKAEVSVTLSKPSYSSGYAFTPRKDREAVSAQTKYVKFGSSASTTDTIYLEVMRNTDSSQGGGSATYNQSTKKYSVPVAIFEKNTNSSAPDSVRRNQSIEVDGTAAFNQGVSSVNHNPVVSLLYMGYDPKSYTPISGLNLGSASQRELTNFWCSATAQCKDGNTAQATNFFKFSVDASQVYNNGYDKATSLMYFDSPGSSNTYMEIHYPESSNRTSNVGTIGYFHLVQGGNTVYLIYSSSTSTPAASSVETAKRAQLSVSIAHSPYIQNTNTGIWTSQTARGSHLSKMETAIAQARADGDNVVFEVHCGGQKATYYFTP